MEDLCLSNPAQKKKKKKIDTWQYLKSVSKEPEGKGWLLKIGFGF